MFMYIYVYIDRNLKHVYVKAMTLGYVDTPPCSPAKLRKKADLDKLRHEIEEEKASRRALSEHIVPPYFQSDIYASILSKQVGSTINRVKEHLC